MDEGINMWIFVLAGMLLLCIGETVQAVGNISRQTILAGLLSNYDSGIAPDFERDKPTVVSIQVHIQNIYSVSASSMDYQLDMLFRQKWVDDRLAFRQHNLTMDKLELDIKVMERIWTPNTYFSNEKTASVHDVTVPNKMIHLYPNGTVLYSLRLSMTLSCAMNLQKYPMDQQLCPIKIECYGYTVENIVFEWEPVNPVELMVDIEIPQYEASMHGLYKKCEENYGEGIYAGRARFACLETKVRFTRKMGYYIVQVFIPSILIVMLSWLSFWVDLDAIPARVSLGVLTVLTMTTQSAGARESLPHVSYVKAIDVWMATCLIMVFLALVEYAYANMLFRRNLKYPVDTVTEGEDCHEISDGKTEATETPKETPTYKCQFDLPTYLPQARSVDKMSRRLFPISFAIFNIIFWLYYLLSPDPE